MLLSNLSICSTLKVTGCGEVLYVCACAQGHTRTQKRGGDSYSTVYFNPLRQGLLLNLVLGQQSANPSNPPVSASMLGFPGLASEVWMQPHCAWVLGTWPQSSGLYKQAPHRCDISPGPTVSTFSVRALLIRSRSACCVSLTPRSHHPNRAPNMPLSSLLIKIDLAFCFVLFILYPECQRWVDVGF